MKKFIILISFMVFPIFSFSLGQKKNDFIESFCKKPSFLDDDPIVFGSAKINHYEFDAIKELEVIDKIAQILRVHPDFSRCDRMLMLWACKVLKNSKSEQQAIDAWRSIAKNNNRDEKCLTSVQTKILNFSDCEIRGLHKKVQDCISHIEPELTQKLLVRVLKRHQWHDRRQLDAVPLRSLAIVEKRKINISLFGDTIGLVKELYDVNSEVPIYERLKNLITFHINDFYSSKGSLVVHDVFDHLWFASKLKESGLFNHYRKFWGSIGSPQLYDIFSREGELFASIAFDFRAFQLCDTSYVPLFSIEDIKIMLDGAATENQKRAFGLLQSPKSEDTNFLRGISFILSGMAIEFLESNRKFGCIKTLDENVTPNGYFNFFNPEHIAFIVESVHLLFEDESENAQLLANICLRIERYLTEVALSGKIQTLSIGLEDLRDLKDQDLLLIPKDRIKWIRRNKGFESIRYSMQ